MLPGPVQPVLLAPRRQFPLPVRGQPAWAPTMAPTARCPDGLSRRHGPLQAALMAALEGMIGRPMLPGGRSRSRAAGGAALPAPGRSYSCGAGAVPVRIVRAWCGARAAVLAAAAATTAGGSRLHCWPRFRGGRALVGDALPRAARGHGSGTIARTEAVPPATPSAPPCRSESSKRRQGHGKARIFVGRQPSSCGMHGDLVKRGTSSAQTRYLGRWPRSGKSRQVGGHGFASSAMRGHKYPGLARPLYDRLRDAIRRYASRSAPSAAPRVEAAHQDIGRRTAGLALLRVTARPRQCLVRQGQAIAHGTGGARGSRRKAAVG